MCKYSTIQAEQSADDGGVDTLCVENSAHENVKMTKTPIINYHQSEIHSFILT